MMPQWTDQEINDGAIVWDATLQLGLVYGKSPGVVSGWYRAKTCYVVLGNIKNTRHWDDTGKWEPSLYLCIVLCAFAYESFHDDVIQWKHFPRYWPFVRGIHRSPVNSPHKGQWRGALMFSLICARINGWVNNREAGDLRHHRTHYNVTVMLFLQKVTCKCHISTRLVIIIVNEADWLFCRDHCHALTQYKMKR